MQKLGFAETRQAPIHGVSRGHRRDPFEIPIVNNETETIEDGIWLAISLKQPSLFYREKDGSITQNHSPEACERALRGKGKYRFTGCVQLL
ncbi:hypothetical protein [Tateyamaria sp. syn59]|uniref:hypothetical protein n=1 Tax=Tateyamaria sp. syn59 TaxID=2576942 RepID=UPI0011BF5EE1|nr:hypothetical protein [Tateyamaria sp. syn59]